MAPPAKPRHFVVDGSNIATEGRTQPSLKQLNEAVLTFIDDYPNSIITVVVDATFGHRIDAREVKEFDDAVANNELVSPPAGAIGRGDAFVLTIANKANAGILSNDSFQEFHGKYEWLFDEGRLIGGKPVPHVGWVFVDRNPVRGPKSRQSVRESKQVDESAQPAKRAGGRRAEKAAAPATAASPRSTSRSAPMSPLPEPASAPPGRAHLNELLPFLEFAEKHPVGTSCTAVVEIYASHGAYARVGDVLIYIPLRSMGDPAPRSARSAFNIGDALTAVIVGYVADRRNVDASLPGMAAAIAATAQLSPSKASANRKAKPAVIEVGEQTSTIGSKPTRRAAPTRPAREPVEAAPLEVKASGRRTAAKAKPEIAETSKPGKKPATPQLAKPVVTKPVATKPVVTKPVASKPVATKPVATKVAKAATKTSPRKPSAS